MFAADLVGAAEECGSISRCTKECAAPLPPSLPRPRPRRHTLPCLHNRDNSLARNVFTSQDIFIWDIIWVVSNFSDLDLIIKVTSHHFVS